ncbi:hypothetical protein MKX75_27490 [Paenibacillus sp. FSL R5-0341]|uniref:hypothetical protein n=1 Tax=Paenibacillus sp. FSL R5-0341 TaxID=2921636 RepID=UPI0030CD00E2
MKDKLEDLDLYYEMIAADEQRSSFFRIECTEYKKKKNPRNTTGSLAAGLPELEGLLTINDRIPFLL